MDKFVTIDAAVLERAIILILPRHHSLLLMVYCPRTKRTGENHRVCYAMWLPCVDLLPDYPQRTDFDKCADFETFASD